MLRKTEAEAEPAASCPLSMPATGSLNYDRPLMACPESVGSLPDTTLMQHKL